jgi:hypothetical protein
MIKVKSHKRVFKNKVSIVRTHARVTPKKVSSQKPLTKWQKGFEVRKLLDKHKIAHSSQMGNFFLGKSRFSDTFHDFATKKYPHIAAHNLMRKPTKASGSIVKVKAPKVNVSKVKPGVSERAAGKAMMKREQRKGNPLFKHED